MKIFRIISFIILGICVVFACNFGWNYSYEWWEGIGKTEEVRSNLWREETSPLPRETVIDLCLEFEIPDSDPLCLKENTIYVGDFYPIIEKVLTPIDSQWADYDEVMGLLGDYDPYCYDVVQQSNGDEYFECNFDLRRDNKFLIVVHFNSDHSIRRLFLNLDMD